jgi:phage gp29-like protein
LIDDSAADWQPQMQPILDPVYALAERSATADEFRAGLAGLLEEMDASELVERLAVAAFKARGLGDGAD